MLRYSQGLQICHQPKRKREASVSRMRIKGKRVKVYLHTYTHTFIYLHATHTLTDWLSLVAMPWVAAVGTQSTWPLSLCKHTHTERTFWDIVQLISFLKNITAFCLISSTDFCIRQKKVCHSRHAYLSSNSFHGFSLLVYINKIPPRVSGAVITGWQLLAYRFFMIIIWICFKHLNKKLYTYA